jgi:lipopolysaccharide cholinephosphotransferase
VALGVNVDVFPLDEWPTGKLSSRSHRARMGLWHGLIRLWQSLPAQPGRSAVKELFIAIVPPLVRRVVHVRPLTRAVDRLAQRPRSGCVTAATVERYSPVPVAVYGEPKTVTFEGRSLPGPANPDAVLTNLYGDWRTPPPPTEQVGHKRTYIVWVDGAFAKRLTRMPPEQRAELKSPWVEEGSA